MVITWQAFSSLILFTNAASVDDLPLPVGPGHQHDSGTHLRRVVQLFRQVQRLEIRHAAGNDAHHDRATAALRENIHAKTRKPRPRCRKYRRSLPLSIFPRRTYFGRSGPRRCARCLPRESTPTPLIFSCISWPWSSTCGARPGENIRSLVFGAACNMDAMILAVGAGPVCSTVAAAGGAGATVGKIAEFTMPTPLQLSGKGGRHFVWSPRVWASRRTAAARLPRL